LTLPVPVVEFRYRRSMRRRPCEEVRMLAGAVLLILCLLGVAGFMDVLDARHGRRQRHWSVILAERRDYEAEMAGTQHRGIAVPIGDICRDRQRGR
jgi:hypothetical protein